AVVERELLERNVHAAGQNRRRDRRGRLGQNARRRGEQKGGGGEEGGVAHRWSPKVGGGRYQRSAKGQVTAESRKRGRACGARSVSGQILRKLKSRLEK